METQVNYKIRDMDEKIVEKGYVVAETVDDDEPEIYVELAQGFFVPENPYDVSPGIDRDIFLEAIWDGKCGEKYEYKDAEYTILIN